MATHVVETTIDDLDESVTEDVITCFVALGESAVEIDLGPDNREELENFLAKYFEAGRSVKPDEAGRGQHAEPARKVADRDRTHEIRSWAKEKGFDVSERGRISKKIVAAFEAAH